MNGEPAKIEIMAPFTAAFEWMKAMLFRPFDIGRWLTIAFAAFLAGGMGGSGANFGKLGRLGDGDFKYSATSHGDLPSYMRPENWAIGCVVVLAVVGLIIGFVWLWISSRGRFIFTDCVVRNRAAIKEPWREFRREGNSYFLFSLLVAVGMIFLIGIMVVVAWVPLQMVSGHRNSEQVMAVPLILLLVVVVLIWLVLALFVGLVANFMVPVMYRRRCLAREAFLDVTKLIFRSPGPIALFVLFGIALVLGVGVIGTALACMTCCIGGLPYVSTVLLLPAIVWLAAYKLLFLRQFGDQYDVWSTAGPASQPAPLPPAAPIAPA